MDLFALAENLKSSDSASGFSAQPITPEQTIAEYEQWDSTPVPDFLELLPDELLDDSTGKRILISQSLIKEHRRMAIGELCPKRFRHVTMLDEFDGDDSTAKAAGRRFEYELTGALDRSGNIPDELLTEAKCVPTADQKRLTLNATLGIKTLKRMGVYLPEWVSIGLMRGGWEVQKKLTIKCLAGTLDLYRASEFGADIIDIKYSGLLGDAGKWSELGWYTPTIGLMFNHIAQAAHYSLLALLTGVDEVTFRFLVFDSRANKEGEYQPFEFRIGEQCMNQHKNMILGIIEDIRNRYRENGFSAIPSYSACQGCPVKPECNQAVDWPETILVEV